MNKIKSIGVLKAFSVTLLVVVLSAFNLPKDDYKKKEVIKWAVQKTSTLKITGKTNVAGFGCDIEGYYQMDTIVYTKEGDPNRITPLRGSLNIDINNFDCHNKMLTSDLRKTLKASQYPYLVVRFIALERMPNLQDNRDNVKGWVDVELSGITKRFEITYKLEKNGTTIQLNGGRAFSFSDFQLTPPQKLAGMVKVKNDFNVDFRLVLNQVG